MSMTRFGILIALLAASPALAQLEKLEELEEARGVIQNRKFRLGHELELHGGTVPLDAFFKGVTVGGRYAFHINEFHAVELGGMYSFNLDSYLTEQLLTNFGVQREALPGLVGLVDLNYVVKPVYGKFALANRQLLYQEVFVLAGATVSYWSDTSLRFGPDIGGGIRFFLGPHSSLRLDIRHAVLVNAIPFIDEEFRIDNVLQLNAGLALTFGG
jgi:outer membrane beta-barrel protein